MQIIFNNGSFIPIRSKELGILKPFFPNENTILSRRNLIQNVWRKDANIKSQSFDQYMVKIRQLLKENRSDGNALRTSHGIGYIYPTKSDIPDITPREYVDIFDVMLSGFLLHKI
jgi:DNA-binding response OmpR family regulator